MTLITRKKAQSCTDKELHSHLKKLFNALASGKLDAAASAAHQSSIKTIKSELSGRRP